MGQKYSSVEIDPKRRAYVRHKIRPSNNQRKSKKKGSESEYTPVGGLPNLSRRRNSDSDDSVRSSSIDSPGPAAGGPGSGGWQSQMMQRAMGPPGGIGGGGGGGDGGSV
ncbi:hypothetical protein KC332_g12163 [Hortaea werneckii]|uniref:Uncharacterized protein n=2 Tax=Hortaea werneckii TaxID=91943 RepID=A0A3M7HFE2_HORWE|nr:hypothetical protein KC350_g5280 [Hortaea werneckii]OTA25587.1 hypothetical protein BTJ68_11268 [Hortaea werneckii EXF-2000]KAI6848094.1 hypothetical protein KC358_g1985 [Hortaea werneckii]KAI6936548.1 hypothetical protein KC348_g5976 [Hortaea werneckii]KAI6942099.1 hypothetical protein KC341_g2447 [Hortaea werneckii]